MDAIDDGCDHVCRHGGGARICGVGVIGWWGGSGWGCLGLRRCRFWTALLRDTLGADLLVPDIDEHELIGSWVALTLIVLFTCQQVALSTRKCQA